MDPSPTARVWTHADLEALPEDNVIREVIGGSLYVSPSPSTRHLRVSLHLVRVLWPALEDTGLARLFVAPHDVRITPHDTVSPDVGAIALERTSIITPKGVVGVPDLLVEILSPSNAHVDGGAKLALYDRARVPEYWIIDPRQESVVQWVRVGDGPLANIAALTRGDLLTSHRFPSVSFAIDELFRP